MRFSSRPSSVILSCLFALGASLAVACSSGGGSNTPTGGTAGAGGNGGNGGGGNGAGGSNDVCPPAQTLLDVSKAPGAGQGYPAPTLSGSCTADSFVVDSNAIPHYKFIPITPNALVAQNTHYEIPLNPEVAAATTELPLLGTVAFAVNGMPIFGPNEGAQPAAEAYGDPIYNGIMDPCLGHTANTYHYHSMLEQCLVASGLVSEPWTNAEPDQTKPSPILGWSLDGFAIHGSRECKDAACSEVIVLQSGYAQIGNPKTNAWDAYQWQAHPGDATYLDACNGHTGPDGEYHYHVTAGFPYVLGCYRGTAMGGGMPQPMGPKSCTGAADCALSDCPPGSVGCTCGTTPMGMICIPTCTTNADCPMGPNGMQLSCNNGVCAP